jgi:murein DD-endopeptidase MepM/ murein hydrolase activator NlpD
MSTFQKSLFLLFICFMSNLAYAQPPLEVVSELNRDKLGYTIYVINNLPIECTVIFSLPSSYNVRANAPTPYIRRISPGKQNLLKLSIEDTNRSASFNHKINFIKGCVNTKLDTNFTYLIPVAKGKKTIVFNSIVKNKKDLKGLELSDAFLNEISFAMSKGDTIFASRKGVVSETKSDFENFKPHEFDITKINFVEIQHDDCTFARYQYFAKDGIFVKPGDEVMPGQPLGIVMDNHFSGTPQLHMHFYHLKSNFEFESYGSAFYHYQVKFLTDGKSQKLQLEKEYTADHAQDIITQEMSKKQKKKYLSGEK